MNIYIGRLPSCGCIVAATIDADDLAEMARNGYLIETVHNAASVEVPGCRCNTTNTAERPVQRESKPSQDTQ